jgi:hypothetical protein
MSHVAIVAVVVLLSLTGCAQLTPQADRPIPQETLDRLALDLTHLQSALVEAQAQAAPEGQFARMVEEVQATSPAVFKAGADERAPSLGRATVGDKFRVLDKVGEWYAVDAAKGDNIKGVGWINAEAVVPVKTAAAGGVVMSGAQRAFRELSERAAKMKQDYASNPYLRVQGFSINIGIPPSLQMNFEFK